ncbi:7005_t:CDS:2, partial [Gigaspora rosea]
PIKLEEHVFYGQVLFYFTHEHEGKISMLAYVQWLTKVQTVIRIVIQRITQKYGVQTYPTYLNCQSMDYSKYGVQTVIQVVEQRITLLISRAAR